VHSLVDKEGVDHQEKETLVGELDVGHLEKRGEEYRHTYICIDIFTHA